MAVLQELLVPLNFDGANFESGLERSITRASAFGSFFGNIASTVVTGAFNLLGEGLEKVGGFLASTVSEAAEAQEGIAQLEAVLKSTGGAAGVTSEMAQELASSFQRVTRFSDDAILAGENMLLTFTSIGKEVFPQATETMLNMSQALGQDLKSSAIQLGKALNNPIEGVSALRRVGVQFTDEQEQIIKKLVESGNLMEAQTFILQELQREFGGSAEAAGKTFAGQLDILKNKLSDIKERIGNAVLPVLAELAQRFSALIDSPKMQALLDTFVTKLSEVGTWIIENLPIWAEKFDKFMGDVETFWTTKAEPALTELATWLGINIPGAADKTDKKSATLATTWNTRVMPAVRELIRFYNNLNTILEKLSPSTDKVAGKFTLLGIAQRLAVATATVINGLLLGLERTLNTVNSGLERVIQKWDSFKNAVYGVIAAIAQLSIPWWLTPGSPTPLEMGLRGIGSAMSDLNKNALPQFAVNIGMNSGNNAAPASSGINYHVMGKVFATEVAKRVGG